MVDNIHRIVAGHEKQELYADEFLKTEVVAVGWGKVGDISDLTAEQLQAECEKYDYENPTEAKNVLLRFRDKIKVGDPVIAYKSPNTVIAIGRIVGDKYFYNDKDYLGSLKELAYPHKWKVNWKEKPRMFDRNFLPDDFSSLVSIPGTFKTLKYDFSTIEEELDKVPEETKKQKVLEVESEEQMRLYFKNNVKQIEPDLTIIDERDTSVGQADILAKENDVWVVIELKRNASDSSVGQLLGYMSAIKEDKNTDRIRGIIIAESISDRVKKAIDLLNTLNLKISLYTCELKFVTKKAE